MVQLDCRPHTVSSIDSLSLLMVLIIVLVRFWLAEPNQADSSGVRFTPVKIYMKSTALGRRRFIRFGLESLNRFIIEAWLRQRLR